MYENMRPMIWRSVADDLPDWGEHGRVELKRADGSIVSGEMAIDAWFNGEDEIPIAEVKLDDGREISIHDFEEWRLVER